MIIAHMGNTAGGTTGAKDPISMEETVTRVQEICDEAKKAKIRVYTVIRLVQPDFGRASYPSFTCLVCVSIAEGNHNRAQLGGTQAKPYG